MCVGKVKCSSLLVDKNLFLMGGERRGDSGMDIVMVMFA